MIFDEIFTARSLVCLCLIASCLVFVNGKRLYHRYRESRIDDLIKSLGEVPTALFQCFDNNLLQNNPGECHLPISSNENITATLGEYKIEKCEREK